ncbi:MAG: hypothetical protein H6843_00185 [Rhodospirillaceae bacterium]|nr:hypothetical protein [Rhodospirillaceae bacterium]
MPVRLSELPAATLPLAGSELLALVQGGATCTASVAAVAAGLAYEVGTWTPNLYGVTTPGTPTYAAQSGRYVLIGDLCFYTSRLQITAKGGLSGDVRLSGLPFTCHNSTAARSAVVLGDIHNQNLPAGTIDVKGLVFNNTTDIYLYLITLTSGNIELSGGDITDNLAIYSTGYYEVA